VPKAQVAHSTDAASAAQGSHEPLLALLLLPGWRLVPSLPAALLPVMHQLLGPRPAAGSAAQPRQRHMCHTHPRSAGPLLAHTIPGGCVGPAAGMPPVLGRTSKAATHQGTLHPAAAVAAGGRSSAHLSVQVAAALTHLKLFTHKKHCVNTQPTPQMGMPPL
jgi:hypothetical protein